MCAALLPAFVGPAAAQETRAENIRQQQIEKSQAAAPEGPNAARARDRPARGLGALYRRSARAVSLVRIGLSRGWVCGRGRLSQALCGRRRLQCLRWVLDQHVCARPGRPRTPDLRSRSRSHHAVGALHRRARCPVFRRRQLLRSGRYNALRVPSYDRQRSSGDRRQVRIDWWRRQPSHRRDLRRPNGALDRTAVLTSEHARPGRLEIHLHQQHGSRRHRLAASARLLRARRAVSRAVR